MIMKTCVKKSPINHYFNSKIICILGPTASGKTNLAIEIAKAINSEIINCDVYQLYKELNIGVNKPTQKEMQMAHFHLIDHFDLNQNYDIKCFQNDCYQTMINFFENNKTPILCGGSNLYIDAVIKNYQLDNKSPRTHEFDDWDNEQLYQKLLELDPEEATKIGNNNHKRLTRALEVIKQTNNKKSSIKDDIKFNVLFILCNQEREALYQKINNRTNVMMDLGWVEEVKNLMDKYPNYKTLNGFKAIGYLDIANAISTNSSIDVNKIKQKTRNYAKRQLTWIRNKYQPQIIFDGTNLIEVIKKVKNFIHD